MLKEVVMGKDSSHQGDLDEKLSKIPLGVMSTSHFEIGTATRRRRKPHVAPLKHLCRSDELRTHFT